MKKLLLLLILLISNGVIYVAQAEVVHVAFPKNITCRNNPGRTHRPGPFYYSSIECQITTDNQQFWKYFKINDNYEAVSLLPDNKKWVTLNFKGSFLPITGIASSPVDRARVMYGLYNPYIPYYVSLISMTANLYSPNRSLADSKWKKIFDQSHHPLYACDADTVNCDVNIGQ